MAFTLVYTERAVRDVRKLDPVARKRLRGSLEIFVQNPLGYSTKLINNKIGEYRFRVGDHRVIFDLVGDDVVILRVGHRREIYR